MWKIKFVVPFLKIWYITFIYWFFRRIFYSFEIQKKIFLILKINKISAILLKIKLFQFLKQMREIGKVFTQKKLFLFKRRIKSSFINFQNLPSFYKYMHLYTFFSLKLLFLLFVFPSTLLSYPRVKYLNCL